MDKSKKEKLKRIFAWVYLVLFVLVILNLMIFDFYKDWFLFSYIALIIIYLAIFKKQDSTAKNTIVEDDFSKENDEITNKEKQD